MRVVALLFAVACLAGCGLKGPLYIPTPAQQRESAEREERLKERQQREREEELDAQQTQQDRAKDVSPQAPPPTQ